MKIFHPENNIRATFRCFYETPDGPTVQKLEPATSHEVGYGWRGQGEREGELCFYFLDSQNNVRVALSNGVVPDYRKDPIEWKPATLSLEHLAVLQRIPEPGRYVVIENTLRERMTLRHNQKPLVEDF